MKNCLFALSLLMISTVAQAQTQRYQNRQLALISFSYTISKDIKANFDEFAHLFPEVDHKKADRIIAVAKEYTWYILKEKLESETGMYILPINSHGSSFKYDEYKFPSVNINKALKQGSTNYYIKVDLIISSGVPKGEMGYGAMPTDDAITEGMELKNACLPVMDMEISIFNDQGILPIQKINASITASTPWVMSKDTFKGLINKEEYKKDETDTLLGLTHVTIAKILRQF